MVEVGDLVVVPDEPTLGVGRLLSARAQDDTVLIHFYDDGELLRVDAERVQPAPAGVWSKT